MRSDHSARAAHYAPGCTSARLAAAGYTLCAGSRLRRGRLRQRHIKAGHFVPGLPLAGRRRARRCASRRRRRARSRPVARPPAPGSGAGAPLSARALGCPPAHERAEARASPQQAGWVLPTGPRVRDASGEMPTRAALSAQSGRSEPTRASFPLQENLCLNKRTDDTSTSPLTTKRRRRVIAPHAGRRMARAAARPLAVLLLLALGDRHKALLHVRQLARQRGRVAGRRRLIRAAPRRAGLPKSAGASAAAAAPAASSALPSAAHGCVRAAQRVSAQGVTNSAGVAR